MEFSDEFSAWRDRIASHEFGHPLGLKDVPPAACPGVTTVMRQTGPDSTTAEIQLRNGYNCVVTNPCPDSQKLPRPERPNNCDVNKAKASNPPGGGGGDDGGGGGDDDGGGGGCSDCSCYYRTVYAYESDPAEGARNESR